MNIDPVEQDVSDRVIPALCCPTSFPIPAALMQRHGDVFGNNGENLVHAPRIDAQKLIGSRAPALHSRAMKWIAEECDAGIVELNVSGTSPDESIDLLMISGNHIFPERIDVLVVALEDALVAACEHMNEDRRWHRYLRHQHGVVLKELKRADRGARPPSDRPVDPQARKRLSDTLLVAPHHFRPALAVGREPVPSHDQVKPPAAAPELAVGRSLKANSLLHSDNVPDAFILDRTQFRAVMRAEICIRQLRSQQSLASRLEPLGT